MKQLFSYAVMFIVCSAVFTAPLFAVGINDVLNPNNNTKPELPPQQLPPLPKPTPPPSTKAAQEVNIPELPPSLPCQPEWLNGLWELQRVYESPLGKETETYNLNPIQYIAYGKDSRFYRFNAGRKQMPPADVYKQMAQHSSALLQYLLQDAGMLYLYQDSVAIDTQVCFVVAETKPPYAAGNLLLMPPKGQITGRLIKVYKKVWPPKQQPKPPAPTPQGPRPPFRPGR